MRKTGLSLLALGALVSASSFTVGTAQAGTSADAKTAAKDAAGWLADQADDQGLIGTDFGLATSAQAVVAFAAAGVGGDEVDAILDELGSRVDDVVKTHAASTPASDADDPGALSYLILAAKAAGQDPRAFGEPATDLVARLEALEGPTGLFGSFDATYDGATRQGLSLMALHAAGVTPSDDAVAWLMDQQCTGDFSGYWMAFRADTAVPCAIDAVTTFTGPESNSTAVAMLGLASNAVGGSAVTAAANALLAERNDDGGFGYFPGDGTDASSTGLVAEALLLRNGSADAEATAALLALQYDCDADADFVGGVAFLDGADPDALSTIQAIPALAGVARPLPAATGGPIGAFNDVCGVANSTTTSSSVTTSSTAAPATTATTAAGGAIPNTGANSRTMGLLGLAFVGLGLVAIGRSRLQAR